MWILLPSAPALPANLNQGIPGLLCTELNLLCMHTVGDALPSCRRPQQSAGDCTVSADLRMDGMLQLRNAVPDGVAAAAALFSPHSHLPCMQRLATPPQNYILKQRVGP